jgi:hypothetical protein
MKTAEEWVEVFSTERFDATGLSYEEVVDVTRARALQQLRRVQFDAYEQGVCDERAYANAVHANDFSVPEPTFPWDK